jgi:oligo-1,6-glucosidase
MSIDEPKKKWWKEGIVYQIYPRSFKDSNGDGIGDLRGIISQLDYIKSLGVDIVWLNPIYASPNDDNGYDISDYYSIMPEFGTMEDFDVLLEGLHQRGIKILMDMVVNHTSDEHLWFQEARKSRTNPYYNFYHWWPAENGTPPKRFSFFDEKSDAWKFNEATNAYYLHYFSVKQPDLNWENPEVRQEVYKIMKFWLDKGVDGFRLDVISFISKDISFPQIPDHYNNDFPRYYAEGPQLHEYLQEMNREVFSKYNCMSVGECVGIQCNNALPFVDADSRELDMFFHFDAVNYGYAMGEFKQPGTERWKLKGFKEIFSKWNDVFKEKGWGSIYLGNHDQPRMVTRWGNDNVPFRNASAKLLLTFLLSMRATPYIYQGDEIGMANIRFDSIDDYRDIETINMYQQIKNKGGDLDYFLESQKITARDNARTPFQWSDEAQAGFTSGHPWIRVNPDAAHINVTAQEKDENSVLNYFRRMIDLRKKSPVLIYGDYELVDKDNEEVYAYTRNLNNEKWLIVLNFTNEVVPFFIPGFMLSQNDVLINNYNDVIIKKHNLELQPYQAVIARV